MNQLDRLDRLIDKLEQKLKQTPLSPRAKNLQRLNTLYQSLELTETVQEFNILFEFKAMNLMGISLQDKDFGKIRKGHYVQILCISSSLKNGKKISKNSSLAYFGKAEKLEENLKKEIIEFILRWRYEKACRHADAYEELLAKLQ